MLSVLLPVAALSFLATFCETTLGDDEAYRSIPIEVAASEADQPLFTELSPEASGVTFTHPIDLDHPQKYLYVGGYASAGVAIGDINGDGRQDIFFTGGPVKNRLYIQDVPKDGQIRFRDATPEMIQGGDKWGAGVALVDIDHDGDLDIYVCYYDAPNELFLNKSRVDALEFEEAAKRLGLDIVDASFMPAFCDYDRDGDLDVFITGYQYTDPAGRPKDLPIIEKDGEYSVKPEYEKYYGIIQGLDGRPTFTNTGRPDFLLKNNLSEVRDRDKMTFTDVTAQAGIEGLGVGNSSLWWDYNADGLPDLFIGNDFKVPDQLYRNNGDGTFTDVVRTTFPHITWFSMGCEAGDINNDGLMDLLVSDMAGTSHYRSKVSMGEMSTNAEFLRTSEPRQQMRNALMVNTGTPRFLEAAYITGMANTDWTWAVKLADFDSDGRVDVYFTNGAARMFNHSDLGVSESEKVGKTQWSLWENTPERLEENLVFRNIGDFKFEDASKEWGLFKKGMSYSAAYGDLDNDGDQDLVVTHLNEPASIYINNGTHNRVRIALRGRASNRFGLGATIHLKSQSGKQVRQVMPMAGFLSCNEPFVHFGLGEDETIEELIVEWPSGIRQRLAGLAANHHYLIAEPTEYEPPQDESQPPTTQFVASRIFPALKHIDPDFNDYERQPLLPFKHSQLGPAFAIADVDGDRVFDYYMGRAKGTPRAVYSNKGRAKLGVKDASAFEDASTHEDMGALFFDADRDGDQDLYIVSGSVECDPADASLRDRLYLNDGSGVFSKAATGAIPQIQDSGSVVCAADYDRDGDLDLFIGGRVVPGQFPVTPASHLLRNDSTLGDPKFVNATREVSDTLANTGLVTSAIWSDANNDGWVDLLVTHDWGPVKVFVNEAGPNGRRLVDQTEQAGLADRLGWWNGIAARDLDNDGDIDYVVTNFGLNTTYHPSDKKPELLYYGDFDNTGRPHLVEAKFEKGKCFPRRGLSCSSHAMPFIRDKVETFHNFGLSTLSEIYNDQNLSKSLQLTSNCLESGILINHSDQNQISFSFQSLPRVAQMSPGFGVVLDDFNADGFTDCFIAQNFFSPQVETGRMDSGLSILLAGEGPTESGEIALRPMWPQQSGILIPGDAKAAAVTDFNEDGWKDLLVTVNDGTIEAFENRPHPENEVLQIRLSDQAGNPTAVGSKVTATFKGGAPTQTAEVYAGGGYLSQSDNILTFGCPAGSQPDQIIVRWPDGRVTRTQIPAGTMKVRLNAPKKN